MLLHDSSRRTAGRVAVFLLFLRNETGRFSHRERFAPKSDASHGADRAFAMTLVAPMGGEFVRGFGEPVWVCRQVYDLKR